MYYFGFTDYHFSFIRIVASNYNDIAASFLWKYYFDDFIMTQHAGQDNIKDHRKSTRTVILNPFLNLFKYGISY